MGRPFLIRIRTSGRETILIHVFLTFQPPTSDSDLRLLLAYDSIPSLRVRLPFIFCL